YRVNASQFINQIREYLLDDKTAKAIQLCDTAKHIPLLQVVKSGLVKLDKGDDAVLASLEESMSDVVPDLEKRTPMLWTLANIATLIGLLGTIRGLIRAFAAVGTVSDASQKTAMLAAGISEAMWNTFLGLLVAVICMIAHLAIHGRAKAHKQQLEKSVMRLENLITIDRKDA